MKHNHTTSLLKKAWSPRGHSFAWIWLFFFSFMSTTVSQKNIPEFSGQQANAIIAGAEFVKQSATADYPEFVRMSPGREINVDQFFTWLNGQFRSGEALAFTLLEKKTDDLDIDHYRYVQQYHGVPIDQSHFTLHSKDNKVYAFNGKLHNIASASTIPIFTEAQALEEAKTFIGASRYMWEDPAWEADLKTRKKDPAVTYFPKGTLVLVASSSPNEFKLAYRFDISALSPMKEVRVCVDAMTGEILYDLPRESNCSAASVNTIFNGNRNISTDFYDDPDYRLRDDCNAAVIHIRDWNSNDLTPNPIEIENSSNTWTTMNERFGATTLWATKQSWAYFLDRFSRDSYDDADGDVNGLINALFNCAPPAGCITANNASMSFTGGNMKVGLSSTGVLTNSYATVDILGHEFTHAVTGSEADLAYNSESGALNESFSDIFGEAIENYVFGTHDWLMGDERDNGFIRSMSDPNDSGDPDTYLGTNWLAIVPPCDGSNDNCGVHRNSGVQNFWFYLVSEGGTDINDNLDNYSVNGIGITKAENIAYRNLVMYLGPNSTYSDARTGSIQSAIDLYGLCSEEVRTVTDAWYAVGVGQPFLNVQATVISDYNGADVSCFGAADGIANATAFDGTNPYVYSWSNGFVGQVNNGLSAGTYYVTVTDANGCTATDAVTLVNPPMLSATIGINSDYNGWPISCFGACDGIVEALPVGGTGPYTYSWSLSVGEQDTKIVSNLCAGEHSVTVTDANGCSTTASVTLLQPPPLEIEAGPNQTIFFWSMDMACTDLEATGADGGVPPYTYEWSSGGTSAEEHVCLEVWEDTITIVTYYVTLTDANGCEAVDSLNVCYVDINCGKPDGPTKVEICHYPPDNPLNPQTICVGLTSLLEHLSHGDQVASCDFVSPCGEEAPRTFFPDLSQWIDDALPTELVLNVVPNPADDVATIQFMSPVETAGKISVINMQGKEVGTIYNALLEAKEIKEVSMEVSSWPPGIYLIALNTDSAYGSTYKLMMIH